jgi:hypothetical protein
LEQPVDVHLFFPIVSPLLGVALPFNLVPAHPQLPRFFPARVQIISLKHEKHIIQWILILPVLGVSASTPPFYGGWLGSCPFSSAHHPEIDHNNNIIINIQDPNQVL